MAKSHRVSNKPAEYIQLPEMCRKSKINMPEKRKLPNTRKKPLSKERNFVTLNSKKKEQDMPQKLEYAQKDKHSPEASVFLR